jgi:hypothetical protein
MWPTFIQPKSLSSTHGIPSSELLPVAIGLFPTIQSGGASLTLIEPSALIRPEMCG